MKTSDEITKIVFQKMADYKAMRKKQLIKYTSIISVFLVAIIAVFLFNINPTTQTPEIEGSGDSDSIDYATDNPDFEVYIELSGDVSYTLDEMIEKSDLIARGKLYYNKTYANENRFNFVQSDSFSRYEPINASDGVEYINTSSTLYTFRIDDVLKGETHDKIEVYTDDYDIYKYWEYEFNFQNPFHFYHESSSNEYILFLKKDEATGYYKLATQPGAISIISDVPNLNSKLKSDSLKVQYSKMIDSNRYTTGFIIKINVLYPVMNDTISKTDLDTLINYIKER